MKKVLSKVWNFILKVCEFILGLNFSRWGLVGAAAIGKFIIGGGVGYTIMVASLAIFIHHNFELIWNKLKSINL